MEVYSVQVEYKGERPSDDWTNYTLWSTLEGAKRGLKQERNDILGSHSWLNNENYIEIDDAVLLMEKIVMIIEKSSDFFSGYSDNCDGIYAAGDSIEAVKADTLRAIELIKKNLPEERWPEQIKGDFEIEYRLDVESFLQYYHL